MMELATYTLETLRTDGEFLLARGRARRHAGATPSSVLVVTPVAERPGLASLRRLEHELALQAELEPGWAVRPLALTQDQGRSLLLLEDPGGEPLDGLLGAPLELGLCLRVAAGLAAALGQLHSRGLIHKDLKPAHVLVNSATGQVWLMGFGIASRLPRERQAPEPPETIAGTLAYMAPEQTGRMNRSVDARSDLYALGVTLYEMLTGRLPFTASDPMEWVHCHIARRPVPPSERVEHVPAPVSQIIMKLLAKTAEDRYQTAAGLERDLRHCLAAWEAQRRIDDFPLGGHDTPDRLFIPEKLYGRERKIETLLASFDRIVESGAPELVLVSGYSGIGKSSVVNELHKVLVPPRGLFASGKFDQYKRDIPYATLAQAFQSLIRPLLGKSEAELGRWRDALREALGPNGQLIVDLVPELKLITGEPPPVPEVPPQDAQRRFQLVFRRFIGVFARPEHPLALFLDDLQWIDAATLDLIEDLLTQSDVRHLMLIGAYRHNEVDVSHPLRRKLDAIRQAGALVQEIVLAPLSGEDVGRLIADSLYCDQERAAPLAQLVHEKTAGNPFFAIQFLSALVEEGLLTFDHSAARWFWDLTRIHAKDYTDNVVDLMVGKLSRLPAETQQALQQLACLGDSAEFALLAMVYEHSKEELHRDLQEALRTGLVLQSEGAYTFLHDRVQEAAYSLLPEHSRAEAHLRIGRRLAAHTPPEKREEAIFEIVNQLNRGVALITSRDEREQLAELNLIAGKRAKASTAYASALTYLTIGVGLLPDDAWERLHELKFALELHRAECEFLTGELALAEERLIVLSNRGANETEQATVACLRIDLYTMTDIQRSLAVGLEYLRSVGIEWRAQPRKEDAVREYERMRSLLGGRSIEELIHLPLVSDAAVIAMIHVLLRMVPPALTTDPHLPYLLKCRAVSLCLEHGNCDASCYAYAELAIVMGPYFGDYQAGSRFAKLAYELAERLGFRRFEATTYKVCGLEMMWSSHVRAARPLFHRALEAAEQSGDLTHAAFCHWHLNTNLLAAGDPLSEAQREAEYGISFAQKIRFHYAVVVTATQLALIRTLRGLTAVFGSFDDAEFDERRIERQFEENRNFAFAECWYWIRKLQARFFAGDYAIALHAASRAERLLWTSLSQFEAAEYHFYAGLSHAALFDLAAPGERQQHVEALTAHYRLLGVWAQHCPENFENRGALLRAEIARIEDRPLDAMDLYEQAIRSAQANGFVQNEALAYELAARFYAARGFEKIAHAYLQDARYGYLRWGADGKVGQLEALYPHLREQKRTPAPMGTIGAPVEHLDLVTVLKVSQAISGEIVLEKLLETLMRMAIEQAGAERGVLILLRGEALRIEAEATTSGDTIVVHLRDAPIDGGVLPESIISYVVRTQESVILDDASAQHPFAADAYVRERHAHSVLCVPLLKQAELIGVLYLENHLAPHVFTPSRLTVLKLLASQAAVALELVRDITERKRAEQRLVAQHSVTRILAEVATVEEAAPQILQALCECLGWDLGTLWRLDREAGVLRCAQMWRKPSVEATQFEAATRASTFRPGRGLPGQVWVSRAPACMPDVVHDPTFLHAHIAAREGLHAAFAFPILLGSEVLGVIDVVSREIRQPDQDWLDMMASVGSQIGQFIERKRAEESLRQAQAELAHVARLTTLGELTASIAHEINQPLGALVNNASACVRWLAAQNLEEARRSAALVIADGHRAAEVIRRIRDLAKKTPLQKEWLDLNATIQDVLALARSAVQRHGVVVETHLAADVPPILGDRVQLQQVLLNLIMNAIEAMSGIGAGPRALRVSSARGAATEVVIAVRDSGPGFDPQSLDRLFDAFYTTKPHGLGLGLAISRRIIEAHGGRLWATAHTPHGAVVQFTVPIGSEGVA